MTIVIQNPEIIVVTAKQPRHSIKLEGNDLETVDDLKTSGYVMEIRRRNVDKHQWIWSNEKYIPTRSGNSKRVNVEIT